MGIVSERQWLRAKPSLSLSYTPILSKLIVLSRCHVSRSFCNNRLGPHLINTHLWLRAFLAYHCCYFVPVTPQCRDPLSTWLLKPEIWESLSRLPAPLATHPDAFPGRSRRMGSFGFSCLCTAFPQRGNVGSNICRALLLVHCAFPLVCCIDLDEVYFGVLQ